MTNEIDKAYAAGIVDGEGCILVVKSRKPKATYYYLAVHVSMADPEAITFLKEHFAGAICTTSRIVSTGQPMLIWSVCSREAATFLKSILPYLRVKHKQAEVAIAFQETMKPAGGRKHFRSAERVAEQHRAYELLRELKRKVA